MTRAALIVAIACALAATACAAVHAAPAVLGWFGALAALAVAVAAGAAARDLQAPDDLREPRRPHGPTSLEPLPPDVIARRGVFGRSWALTLGAFALTGLVPLIALARRPVQRRAAFTPGARLVTRDGRPLRAADLAVDAVETVFPQGRIDQPEAATLLIRLPDDVVRTHPGREGWTPLGNVAYSKICTHAGCPVALYRHASHELYCPCHQSVFDVLDAARPLSGPATRALPQLGLDVDRDGYLVARGDFSGPVGPDEWWRTR